VRHQSKSRSLEQAADRATLGMRRLAPPSGGTQYTHARPLQSLSALPAWRARTRSSSSRRAESGSSPSRQRQGFAGIRQPSRRCHGTYVRSRLLVPLYQCTALNAPACVRSHEQGQHSGSPSPSATENTKAGKLPSNKQTDTNRHTHNTYTPLGSRRGPGRAPTKLNNTARPLVKNNNCLVWLLLGTEFVAQCSCRFHVLTHSLTHSLPESLTHSTH
jgi:hypothetical protein